MPDTPDAFEVRDDRSLLWFLILGGFFFGGMILSGILGRIWEDPDFIWGPKVFAWIHFLFWSGVLLSDIYLIAAILGDRILVTSECLKLACVFTVKSMRFSEIRYMRWRLWPAGESIVLKDGRLRIAFGFVTLDGKMAPTLASALRNRVDMAIQQNWEPFRANYKKLTASCD